VLVRNLRPTPKQYEVHDAQETGLSLRVNPKGTKTFCGLYRDPVERQSRRKTLGRYPELSLAKARKAMRKLKLGVGNGKDPVAELRVRRDSHERQVVTNVLASYAENHLNRNTRSSKERLQDLERAIRPLLRQRIDDIKRIDLSELIDDIVNRRGPS